MNLPFFIFLLHFMIGSSRSVISIVVAGFFSLIIDKNQEQRGRKKEGKKQGGKKRRVKWMFISKDMHPTDKPIHIAS